MTFQEFINGAAGRLRSYIAKYNPDEKTIKYRTDICNSCEYLGQKENKITKKIRFKCNKCTCPIDRKVLDIKSECPINKWPKGNIK